MWGAIIGDIVGSVYEFSNNREYDFGPLIGPASFWTDDTVLTVATADWLLSDRIRSIAHYYRSYGLAYPDSGYGGMFREWLHKPDMGPYGSRGNGAAMRVSPCGLMRSRGHPSFARRTAEATHNSGEAIYCAETVESLIAIYYENTRTGDDAIDACLREHQHENVSIDALRKDYRYSELALTTLLAALACIKHSTDFESCMRNCVSIGGDADTIAATAGGIAEAKWGTPESLKEQARAAIPPPFITIMDRLYEHRAAGPSQPRSRLVQ